MARRKVLARRNMARTKQTPRKSTGLRAQRRESQIWDERQLQWKEPHAQMIKLKEPIFTQNDNNWCQKPLYYQQSNSNKQYLIIMPFPVSIFFRHKHKQREDKYIVKYDISIDEYLNFAKIPESLWEFPCGDIVAAIHDKNDKLYIFKYNHNKPHKAYILDLITAKWTIEAPEEEDEDDDLIDNEVRNDENKEEEDPDTDIIQCPNMMIINKSNGSTEGHFVYCHSKRGYHVIYNFDTKKFIQQTNNNCNLIKLDGNAVEWPERTCFSPNIVYIKHLHKLMIIGASNYDPTNFMGNFGEVWTFDVEKENAKWENRKDLQIPNFDIRLHDTAVTIGFDSIVYVWCVGVDTGPNEKRGAGGCRVNEAKIWCLDLYEMKWYESNKYLPEYILDSYNELETLNTFITTNNRYVHHYNPGGPMISYTAHVKICLYDVCPMEIKKNHRERYDKLIFGFVRDVRKVLDVNVPDYLSKLILQYFTLFV